MDKERNARPDVHGIDASVTSGGNSNKTCLLLQIIDWLPHHPVRLLKVNITTSSCNRIPNAKISVVQFQYIHSYWVLVKHISDSANLSPTLTGTNCQIECTYNSREVYLTRQHTTRTCTIPYD